jgi:hypothetical protein
MLVSRLPHFSLDKGDADWGDCPDDTSNISVDWDDYCHTQGEGYPVQKGVGIVE